MFKIPIFSVIVCTAVRVQLLGKCLESLLTQTISSDEYEIIVVNNVPESEPEVKALIVQIDKNNKIFYTQESEEGLSAARNHGISLAKGDIFVFIDDDAVAEPNWLEELLKIYRTYPNVAVVGGKISLVWESDIPRWLHSSLYGPLGELDYGNGVFPIQKDQRLGGGNFSIKRSWLEKSGGFVQKLGRNRRSFLSGEEIELFIRIWNQGGQCYYNSAAVVFHPAPLQRMNKDFFRKRVYWGARSEARIDRIHTPEKLIRKLFARIIRLPYHFIFSIFYKFINRPSLSFLWETFYWSTVGYSVEVIYDLAND